MEIAGRDIGPGQPPYIIAEVSANHGGKIDRALELIDAAKVVGADAVKFQCYSAETITLDCDRPEFTIKDGPWAGRRLYDLYQETQTPLAWFPLLAERAKAVGIAWFASCFDRSSVDLMVQLGAPAIKIASFEIVDTPLIEYAAKTHLPLIISAGMATLPEAQAAHWACVRGHGHGSNYMILHCISGYPAPIEESNLQQFYGVAGISDHTLGIEVPIAATALGAAIIEKHFRLGHHPRTEDSAFSLDRFEFTEMARAVRRTWSAMQDVEKKSEEPQKQLRRSLFVVEPVKAGEAFTEDNVRSIRPGAGLPPGEIAQVIGKKAARDVERGEPMSWELVS